MLPLGGFQSAASRRECEACWTPKFFLIVFFLDLRARASFRWANLKPSLFLSPTGQKTPPPRRQKVEKFAFCSFFLDFFLDLIFGVLFEEKPLKMASQIDQQSHFFVTFSRHVFRTRFGEAKKVKIMVSSRRYAHFQRSKGFKKKKKKHQKNIPKPQKNDS